MKALYLERHAAKIDDVQFNWIDKPTPSVNENESLVKISASGINPSDALAATGYFNHAVLPRIPGRDFSGTIVKGPEKLIGKKVWGTGGAAGISADGTQAEYIKLFLNEIAECPNNMDLITAGAQTLPYVTAYYGLVKRAHLQENESVLITGALGQVGSAAVSICQWKKCHVVALVRGKEDMERAKKLGWNTVDSDDKNLYENLLKANHGKSFNVIFNSVGNIYWHDFMRLLNSMGRIVTISARENMREVTVNLFELYRANQDLININTVPLDLVMNVQLLNEMKTGFEQNQLIPLKVDSDMIFTPENANQAYKTVLSGSAGKRVVIKFE